MKNKIFLSEKLLLKKIEEQSHTLIVLVDMSQL